MIGILDGTGEEGANKESSRIRIPIGQLIVGISSIPLNPMPTPLRVYNTSTYVFTLLALLLELALHFVGLVLCLLGLLARLAHLLLEDIEQRRLLGAALLDA